MGYQSLAGTATASRSAPASSSTRSDGTFVGQSFTSDAEHHTEIVEAAIEHDRFGFVNVFSPSVAFSDVDTCDSFRGAVGAVRERFALANQW